MSSFCPVFVFQETATGTEVDSSPATCTACEREREQRKRSAHLGFLDAAALTGLCNAGKCEGSRALLLLRALPFLSWCCPKHCMAAVLSLLDVPNVHGEDGIECESADVLRGWGDVSSCVHLTGLLLLTTGSEAASTQVGAYLEISH